MASRAKIQIVEGDGKAALAYAGTFRQRGWEVVSASDASTAMSVAMQARPDAVVLNMEVPGGGGLAVLKRMRASVHTAITPVIVIGRDADSRCGEFLSAGAQDCLGSSCNAEALCGAIEKHLSRPMPAVGAPNEVLRAATRMAALKASGLLDSQPEESYDQTTELAAKLLGVPVALLSLVDRDRQFFKSQVGLPDPWATERQTPLSHSFCQWVVSGREDVRIEDARLLPLLRENLAIRDLGVVAYAGVPVFGREGQALGSFCAIDTQPREWSDFDVSILRDLASLVEVCVAQRELANDPPTCMSDFDRHVDAAGNAIGGAVGILRRSAAVLDPAETDTLYGVIRQNSQHLVQLNRLIQVADLLD